MPFKSKSQQKYLFAKHPEIAQEFAEHTPKKSYQQLPEKVENPHSKTEHMKRVSHRYMRSKSI